MYKEFFRLILQSIRPKKEMNIVKEKFTHSRDDILIPHAWEKEQFPAGYIWEMILNKKHP